MTLGDAAADHAGGDRAVPRRAAGGARAVYDGRPGHPVVLGPEQLARSRALRGDQGARELLGGRAEIECWRAVLGRDVDTPEDLEAMRDEARAVV